MDVGFYGFVGFFGDDCDGSFDFVIVWCLCCDGFFQCYEIFGVGDEFVWMQQQWCCGVLYEIIRYGLWQEYVVCVGIGEEIVEW